MLVRVQACVSCEVIQPKLNRSTEGQLYFNVTLSPMASPWFELGSRYKTHALGMHSTVVLLIGRLQWPWKSLVY